MVVPHPANQAEDAKHLSVYVSTRPSPKNTPRLLTWDNDILVVAHKIFKDGKRCGLDIDVAPVYP